MKNNRLILILLLVLLLLVAVVIAVLVLSPSLNKLLALNARLALAENKLENSFDSSSAKKHLIEAQDLQKKLTSGFIKNGQEINFISAMESSASSSGVKIEINADWLIKSNGAINRIPLDLSAEGDYASLMNFLGRIESSPYYIQITQLELAKEQPTRLSLKGNIFILNE